MPLAIEEIIAEIESLELQPKDFRILVVDDEPVIRNVCQRFLSQVGYRVDTAEDGVKALASYDRSRAHLIMSDKNMPDMDGLQLFRAVRQKDPECEFIMMTGFASMESAVEAIDLRVFAYLHKPFEDLQLVRDKVQAALKRHEARIQNTRLINRLTDTLAELAEGQGGAGQAEAIQEILPLLQALEPVPGRLEGTRKVLNWLKSRLTKAGDDWADSVRYVDGELKVLEAVVKRLEAIRQRLPQEGTPS